MSRNSVVISLECIIEIPKFLLLCRPRSQCRDSAHIRYDIFSAEHADDIVIPGNGELVDTIAIHPLLGVLRPGIGIDAFYLFQRDPQNLA
jgi:hypothetical protein